MPGEGDVTRLWGILMTPPAGPAPPASWHMPLRVLAGRRKEKIIPFGLESLIGLELITLAFLGLLIPGKDPQFEQRPTLPHVVREAPMTCKPRYQVTSICMCVHACVHVCVCANM